MLDWERMSPAEQAARLSAAVAMAAKLVERLRQGDPLGAAVCGLAAAAALGLDADEVRDVAKALESYG